MTIESYEDLSPLGRIIYTKYKSGGLTVAQVESYVSKGKITAEESAFIIG